MNTFNLIDAKIVTPHEIIHGVLTIEEGKITQITPQSAFVNVNNTPTIDVNGAFVLPGIIDIHTDAIDKEIMPRKSADFPIGIAFRELERRMSGCGITTVYHSMHLGYKKAEESAQSKYSREELFKQVFEWTQKENLIHNKIHLRFELTGTYHYDLAMEVMRKGYVHLLSVMDHRPGQGQYGNISTADWAKRVGISDAEAQHQLMELKNQEVIEGERLKAMIDLALELGIGVASHDDDSVDKVEEMHKLGIDISEFPINEAAAQHALQLGMHTVAGASNVIRGGSLTGNLNVADAIAKGLIQSLCSDYYPPSIIHAAFMLVKSGTITLPQAANLIALNPAKAVKTNRFTGSIELGKNADLIVVSVVDDLPLVEHTIVDGRLAGSAQMTKNIKEKVWL